ncbi:presenilin-1-like [Symsagittifera roscoffensis]|uniref:presenilin-1-like n=1 Tax=Symsagittifera roscoffensis TaxID=84072 RepID=UPI00307C258D
MTSVIGGSSTGPLIPPLAQGEPDADEVDGTEERRHRQASEDEAQDVKYGAKHIVLVIVPVTVCMIIVCFSITQLDFYQKTDSSIQPTLYYTPLRESNQGGWGNLGIAVLNSLIFVSIVLVMTTVLVLLYKYRCYRVIHGWLIVSSFFLLFYFSFVYMISLAKWMNIALDFITTFFFLLNFGVLGMLAIHWKGPLVLQQMYLIIVGALMALLLIRYIPDWTTWVLLGVLALYDLAAVLLPVGPLRVLVQLAQERDEPIFPALIYSSAMVTMADSEGRVANDDAKLSKLDNSCTDRAERGSLRARHRGRLSDDSMPSETAREAVGSLGGNNATSNNRTSHNTTDSDLELEDEERGVKLGLGDFIFYSILIGKAASSGDYTVVFAVYIAIIFGLISTVVLLAFMRRALPALPISIFFGLSFYFSTMFIVSPYVERLSYDQLFL